MITPHPYQQDYLDGIRSGWRDGFRRQLIVSPTGSGKTNMFCWVAQDFIEENKRVLILVDQVDLAWQARERMAKVIGVMAEVEQAENSASRSARVVIASVQTLARRLSEWPQDHFDLVICDEADKSISAQWQTVLNHFDGQARVAGFTATPHRTDKKNLGVYYDNSIEKENLVSLIQKGFLSPISIQMMPIKLDLSGVTARGDITDEQADEIITPHLSAIAQSIQQKCSFRRTLVFLPLIRTCERFTEICRSMGMTADYVYGDDPERESKIKRFRNWDFDILANSMLLTRGVDIPEVDAIVPCRPTKSVTLYFQMVGRGTRIAPGKTECLLLDFLYQANKRLVCRPANLIAKSDEEVEQIAKLTEASAALPADVIAQLDLIEVAAEASSQREEALRKKLDEQKNKKAKTITAEEFALNHGSMSAAEYEPTMPWESQPVSEKHAKALKRAGIDVATVKGKGHATKLLGLHFASQALTPASQAQKFKMRQMGCSFWQTATAADARRWFAELRNRNQQKGMV